MTLAAALAAGPVVDDASDDFDVREVFVVSCGIWCQQEAMSKKTFYQTHS